MNKRVEYAKRLFKKGTIIELNCNPKEKEEISLYLEELGNDYESNKLLLNDKEKCTCKKRTDVLAIDDKKYCTDCYKIIKTKEDK